MAQYPPGNPFGPPATATSNPFDNPTQAVSSPSPIVSGNPFDPFAAPTADAIPAAPGGQAHSTSIVNPFDISQEQAPAPFYHQPQQEAPHPQPQPQPQVLPQTALVQQPIPTPQQSNPFSQQHQSPLPVHVAQHYGQQPHMQSLQQSPYAQQPPATDNALVAFHQPTNQYAGLVAPQQGNPFAQAIVPMTLPAGANQWATPPVQPALFDPFAPPPVQSNPFQHAPPAPPPQQPLQQPHPDYSTHQQQYAVQQQQTSMMVLAASQTNQYALQEQSLARDPMAFDDPPPQQEIVPYTEEGGFRETDSRRDIVPFVPPQMELGADIVPGGLQEPPIGSPVNKYSQVLAQNAPSGSAPLPKGDLVIKSGYVLSRISFRTILMKKWKQVYWVQYGPHAMLWFRSHADFDDWLNNPYLTQEQRNYLIKLAVNFVHDLYKPNVRGYQVTQARSKAYGRKMLKQFKLERWMDYGPTIAAAFASHDANEIDELRQSIVECMRNTPVGDGIRATGAVRQDHNDDYLNQHRIQQSYEVREHDGRPSTSVQTFGQQGAPPVVESPPPPRIDLLDAGDDDNSLGTYSQGPGFYGLNGFEPAQRGPQGHDAHHGYNQQQHPQQQQQGYNQQQQQVYPQQGFTQQHPQQLNGHSTPQQYR